MFKVLKPVNTGRVYSNFNTNKPSHASFQNLPDRLELQTLERFFSESFIKRAISANPAIKKILQAFNPEIKLNMQELQELQLNHCKETQDIAKGITKNLPFAIQNKIDTKSLYEAAYLHDVGKVLIPDKILNKPDKLNFYERTVMDTHSLLGFELLKNSGLSSRTLNLIKNHHKKTSGFEKTFLKNRDYTLQLLSTADKYSALLENRVYKKAMTPQEALTIIYQDVKSGDLDAQIFNALVKYSQNKVKYAYTQ